MFCCMHNNHASTNLKKVLSWKVHFIYLFPRRLVLGKSLQTCCINFFHLSWHFKLVNFVFLKASFLQIKNWLHLQKAMYNTSWLVRISPLITARNKDFCFFFLGNLFYKSNRKLVYCVCIHGNTRGVDRILVRLCLGLPQLFQILPTPSHVYIRLCIHRKRFLFWKWLGKEV